MTDTQPLSEGSPAGAVKDLQVLTCLSQDVRSRLANGFEAWRLESRFPDFAFDEIDTSCRLLGKPLKLPLFVSSLTGGGERSARINGCLAQAAQRLGIGMALGSQRIMLQHPALARSFQVRHWAPDILLLANLGLVHLNRGLTREDCLRAVETIGADGLIFYLNPMHEVLQEAGDTDFSGLLEKLGELVESFPYPVLVKEVGFGLSKDVLRRLAPLGLAGVDVAGAGGTDWGRVERAMGRARPSASYEEFGVPTAEALEAAVRILPECTAVLASGGVRTGVEIAKAVALGARCVGMALPFLSWADDSAGRVIREVEGLAEQIRVAMWYAGAPDLSALRGRASRSAEGRANAER
jgi:isopentenyl-diphosphate delta-isomerase